MPFQTQIKTEHLHGKEHDSFVAHSYTPNTHTQTPNERVSGFASQGSITVEATIAVSLFFFAMMTLASLFEIMYLQTTIKSALCSVGKQMAAESYFQPLVLSGQMEKRMVELIGEEVLENSYIVGGKDGIDCSRSRSYLTTTIMELQVDYQIELPFLMFRIPILSRSESIRIKGWSGKEGDGIDLGENEVVYMTEHGIVYHSDISCTHLELSIHPVSKEALEEYRNAGGEKYSACLFCKEPEILQKVVYVTEQGDRYHSTLDCIGLKRTVYTVLKKEIYGIGGCSKCVK